MKKFLAGIVFGVVLSISVSVYAEEVKTLVGQAIQGTFPVKVNGELLKNEAVVLDGTSYLPVREISEKFGMDVKFSPETGIELNDPPKPETTAPFSKTDSTGLPMEYWTMERIDSAIESQKRSISLHEDRVRIFGEAAPATKEQELKLLQDAKDRLAELEKMKSDLETKTPE